MNFFPDAPGPVPRHAPPGRMSGRGSDAIVATAPPYLSGGAVRDGMLCRKGG
ncbi:protein of unknown function [Rhodovastum atsumiense]|nr:protein of unknown function [Rhodovastum atsumiense]